MPAGGVRSFQRVQHRRTNTSTIASTDNASTNANTNAGINYGCRRIGGSDHNGYSSIGDIDCAVEH
jgi:hypothetical protein